MPLLGLSLFLGFYPKPVLDRVQPSRSTRWSPTSKRNSDYKAPDVNKPCSTEGDTIVCRADEAGK